MAEKKVSVRLSADGGRQVRAELEGIGDAGPVALAACRRKWKWQTPGWSALLVRPGSHLRQ